MATRMPTPADVTALPRPFRDAVAQLRAARLRPEIICEEMPAPQRIAPFSAALAADVVVDGDEVGTGRLVVLHDPAGNDTWGGTFRCVAYARAELTADFAADPVLADVAWTWLVEALEANDADHVAPSGTVTRVITESFGQMSDDGASAQLEVRASWTPLGDLGVHVRAWGDLLAASVGLEPVPEGVATLVRRRTPRLDG
jgi:hypothetical protein